MKHIFYALIPALFPFVFGMGHAMADDITYLDISNPFIRKTPLAAPRFKLFTGSDSEKEDAEKARGILKDALDFTGYIKIIDDRSFMAEPAEDGITKKSLHFPDWTGIGAELLVTGGIKLEKDRVRLYMRLFDTVEKSLLAGKVYTGHREDIRIMVHRFCSEISLALTGKPGIFGSKIAFISKSGGNKEIYMCDFDGNNPVKITDHKNLALSPAFSSNSEWIAYTSYHRGKPDLYIRNIREKRGAIVNKEGMNISPDWHPERFELAASLSFSGDQEIYLLTGKGKIIKKVTDSWGIDVSPAFSPDGKRIAFVSNRGGSPQIYIKSLETGELRRLTFKGDYNTSPAWSPNGDRIAYVGVQNGSIDIYTIRVDGGYPVQLTKDAGDNEDPAWSPDGSMIAFTSSRENGVRRLYVMTAGGNEQRRLLKLKGSQMDPDWSMVSK
ncbi:MAG: Tol-Pal system beta propeller repeat protein TolB [Desulfobacteraceae bacterium]